MGAWGTGIFENDDALDYAAAIVERSDLTMIESTLDNVLEMGEEYLEAPQAAEGLAAADILTRLLGKPGQRDIYTAKIDQWAEQVKLNPSMELVDKAKRSIVRITTPPSELLELWSEGQDADAWNFSVEDLIKRLG